MSSTEAATKDRRKPKSRRNLYIVLGVIALFILIAAYLEYLIFDVKGSVETARTHAAAAKSAVLDGDVDKAQSEAKAADDAAQDARDTSGNPVWTATAAIPAISSAVIDQIGSMKGNTGALLEALGNGVQERRIMVYSNNSQEQKILETTALGHQLPGTSAPYMNVTVGNVAGNKIDYYLRREISYTAGSCEGQSRESTATISLTNTLDDLSLPEYVIGSLGAPQAKLAKGTSLANVQFTLTKGAVLQELTVNGKSVLYSTGTLYGHPVVFTQVPIPAGETVEVKAALAEPTSAHGEAVVPVQPLVDNPTPTVDVPVCGD